MENFVHDAVSRAALADFAQNARAAGVQLHAMEIFNKDECLVRWSIAPYRCDGAFGQLCVVLPDSGLAAAITAECTNMCAELNALWTLLENLHAAPRTAAAICRCRSAAA